jgi:hypothetical protein
MISLKHVGRFVANGRKCLVAYRSLPGDAYNCLVVPTENLPDDQHDALIQLVESPSAQESHEFAEVLARARMPDGSIMLAALHTQGKLVKVPTDQVEMIPNFQTRVRLDELNVTIAQQMGIAVDDLAITDPRKLNSDTEVTEVATVKDLSPEKPDLGKTTSASVNETEQPTTFASKNDEAKFYRSQADKLAKQAAEFRRKAEELDPKKKK